MESNTVRKGPAQNNTTGRISSDTPGRVILSCVLCFSASFRGPQSRRQSDTQAGSNTFQSLML
jgi:hypothetical protein